MVRVGPNENLAQLSTHNKVLLSMDINKFYPSIVPEKAAEIAKLMWLKSTVEIENIDVEELAFYIGNTCSKDEIRVENLSEVVYLKKKMKKKKLVKKIMKKQIKMKKLQKSNKNLQNAKIQSEKSPKVEKKKEDIWLKPKIKANKNEL